MTNELVQHRESPGVSQQCSKQTPGGIMFTLNWSSDQISMLFLAGNGYRVHHLVEQLVKNFCSENLD